MKANQDVIEEKSARDVMRLPIASVATTFRVLTEEIALLRKSHEVVLIPMGSKPQVLSCILLSKKFPDVSCLRVSSRLNEPQKVDAAGPFVCTSIVIQTE